MTTTFGCEPPLYRPVTDLFRSCWGNSL